MKKTASKKLSLKIVSRGKKVKEISKEVTCCKKTQRNTNINM